ncbi:cytochrome ubiquinol oxidase subunit II [Thioclava sp. BHET1]|nr:cytochrome ubiquinol oxidase subunit II [Thioclava sp. BHET1]
MALPASFAVAALWLSGCAENGVMTPSGPIAAAEKSHMIWFFLWMLPVCLPILIGLPWICIKYRRKGGKGAYRPNWSHSTMAETLIWGGSTLTVILLGVLIWINTIGEDPYKHTGANPIKVQVVGSEWKWMFIYPGKMATVNKVVLPPHTPVEFDLTAAGAMQSFWIPRLAGQIYAMPGMQTKMNMTTGDLAKLEGFNSQFNGAAFPLDKFEVDVVSKQDYEAFLQSPRQPWNDLLTEFKKVATWNGPQIFDAPPKGWWDKASMDPSMVTNGGAAILDDHDPEQKSIDKAIHSELHLSQNKPQGDAQ